MSLLWGGGRFEDTDEAKRAVEELVKQRDDLQQASTALQKVIDDQKQVLQELEQQVDAAQRRASESIEEANVKIEEVRATDVELSAAKGRLQQVLNVLGLERDFRRLSQSVGQVRAALFPAPLVIAGPSAVGKATLISKLFHEFPNAFSIPISHTSRPPAQGEENGVHYVFVARAEMEEVDGHLYGTTVQALAKEQNVGRVCLLHIDLAGAVQLKQSKLQLFGTDFEPDDAEISERLLQAEKDISDARENASLFDFTIVNDELAEAYDALKQVLRKYPHMREMMTRMPSSSD